MLRRLSDRFADFAGRFYDWGMVGVDKLSNGLKLPQLASLLNRRWSRRPAVLGVELLVALSLTVTFYFLVRPTCKIHRDGNQISAQTFCYLSKGVPAVGKDLVQLNWKKRLAGPILSGWLLDEKFKGAPDFTWDGFQSVFGFYHATWLFLLFLVLIVYRKDALLIMFAVFGGLMYNLTDTAQPPFYYPWDLPTMFFFTLACLLYDSRRLWPLMVVVWLGGLFKETTLCCALLILLGEHWTLKKRVAGFAATVIATFAANKFLMTLYGVKAPILAMNDAPGVIDIIRNTRLFYNFDILFGLNARHVLFANAGSLLIIMLIPWRNRRDVVFKLLMVSFVIGEFFCGIINEVRIWYELLPLGWMMIADALLKERPMIQEDPVAYRRANRVWQGSYWLMMGTLLAVTLGVLALAKFIPARLVENNPFNQSTSQKLISSARAGDAEAQYNLGRIYQQGIGVKQNNTEAADWYRRAAEQGHSEAQNSLGLLLVADQRDYPGAAQWFAMAARQGNADAQYNLGVIYFSGLGVNYGFAAHWFQLAAQQGHVQAQRDLGKMYERGQGVMPDYVEAYQWLKLAQLQEDEEAGRELKACAASMTPDQIAAAEKLVQEGQTRRK
jgi:Sel1 repeat